MISLPTSTLTLLLLLVGSISCGTLPEERSTLSRSKRGVTQLAVLVDRYTRYRSGRLIGYGNWCGLGGDRARDGSVTDACDACCKVHDDCFQQLLLSRESLIQFFVNSVSPDRRRNGRNYNSKSSREKQTQTYLDNLLSRTCIPYSDIYEVYAPKNYGNGQISLQCDGLGSKCAYGACVCDVNLVQCLRNTRCNNPQLTN